MTVDGSMSPTTSPVTGRLERETARYYKDRKPMEDPAVKRREDGEADGRRGGCCCCCDRERDVQATVESVLAGRRWRVGI